ncbi:SET domain-containing protein-lysine N-methyltransferase [Mesorhizobium argentiipisi]|uniref:SET domain-containing protein-lysine N-methyltransferase n=1 Tax=Mesorhizobium argentiipisi TaxID=3015175 RepID=A0ABU8K8A7_9HYPH
MRDKLFDRDNSVYIKQVEGKGRGLFAGVPFKAGDLIDRAPTWGFDYEAVNLLKQTGLLEFYFVRHNQRQGAELVAGYVVFGFMSIANHSLNPNAKTIWNDGNVGAGASMMAVKDIKVDEEITQRYNNIVDYPRTIKFIE